ncbi:MAG: NAD(+) synthase [Coriobacteriia bacterium]|nr:NAD(+) synthase [Coriobacteriia bacterium]
MEVDQKYQVCVDGLREYAQNAGFTEAVVGLSGGIDSSVIAVMCAQVFGAENVHGVLLPGPYSSSSSVEDATELAANLGIETQTVSICEPFEAFEKVMAKPCGGSLRGLAAENTQARCRMVVLMALSNTYGWMLVNTGNKSEACMGYSTLYGDTAGAYAPMGCLYKTDVFAVARWCNERATAAGQVPPIPENVLIKPPSAELSPGQQDEKSLGLAYASLDKILIAYFEEGQSVEDIAAAGFSKSQVEQVIRTANSYAFKRAMEPPFPQAKIY